MLRSAALSLALAYHYDLWLPEDAPAGPLLVCLHGYGQSKADALEVGRAFGTGWPLAALQAPHPHHKLEHGRVAGVGFGWVSAFAPEHDIRNHHDFILSVLRRLRAEGVIEEERAFLFGFSQSVSLNYRFARAHPEALYGLVAVAGAVPSDWLEEADKAPLEVPVLHLSARSDESYPPARAERFRAELEMRCRDLTWLEEDGGHRVPRAAHPKIRAWLEGVWVRRGGRAAG